MNEDLKFPIKYAVLELKRNGGYSTNYEDVTEGFIVSKCFLMESKIGYMANGEQVISYKVYFPYNNISGAKYFYNHYNSLSSYKEERERIGINARGDYYPVEIVDRLFDTYEEAKKETEHRNKCLKSLEIVRATFAEDKVKERIIDRFEQKMQLCQKYEDFIIENTKDMKVTKDNLNIERIRKKD